MPRARARPCPTVSLRRAARLGALLCLAAALLGCTLEGSAPVEVAYRWDSLDGPYTAVAEANPAFEPVVHGRVLWLRLIPPAVEAPAAVLVGPDTEEVRQDGHVLYRPGDAWPVVALPSAEAPVFLRYTAHEPRLAVRGDLRFDRADALTWRAVRASLAPALAGITLVVAAAFLLILAARRRQRELLHLAGFAGAIGIMLVGAGYPASAFVVPSPRALLWMMELGTLSYPFFFARFVDTTFLRGRDRALRLVAFASAAWCVLAVVLSLAFVAPLATFREWSYVIVVALIVRTLGALVPRAWRGDPDARTFAAGLAILVLVSGTGILEGMGVRAFAGADLTHWGMLLFVGSLGVLLERRIRQQATELAATTTELSAKLAALETRDREVHALNAELREQVAQRSRELAEALAHPEVHVSTLGPNDLVDGRYRVVARLGHGGMGEVFEVERLTDRSRFALKVMREVRDSSDVGRFAREAEIAARLEHTSLVRVVDVGYAGGLLYLVMELVTGDSLEAARERFGDVPWALGVLRGIAAGLAALHAAGIVHRDLKPANVLLEAATGTAKITDFGIARVEDIATPLGDTAPAGTPRGELTVTGALIGTPHYIAPEQVRGVRGARPASDIFSFGVLAHELLARELPFRVPAVYEAFAGRTPPRATPLADLCPSLPPPLAAALDRACSPDPSERPTAAELLLLL